ncbi:MAG: MauE/DoxX family redox-associated membrane protein [Rariglobus sp.]|nr:MauE/DoxX family redox-associated membrane protein [Rariglobus sp.]
MSPRRIVIWVLAIALAAILGYAGTAKLRDPAAFATDIENFQLLPPGPSALLAVYLPWLELLLAAGLLLPRWRAAAGLLTSLLFAVFTLAVGLAWARGLDITCGCFGHGTPTALPWAFLRNLTLLAAATAQTCLSLIK